MMDLRSSDEASRRDIPSFIEPRPPLILHPFMRPRPEKGIKLFEKFDEDSDIEEPELVQVYLRMKPCKVPNNLYELRSDKCLVTSLDTTTAGHGRRTQHNVSKSYTFSRIFKPECTQKEIFEQVVKGNLRRLVDGHSFTLLTYGASGSGKTYTVMGTVNSPGLVPRSLEYLFKLVEAAQTPLFKPSESGTDQLCRGLQDLELQLVKRLLQVSAPFRDKYRRMSAQLHSDLTVSSVDLTNRMKHYVWVSFVEIYNEAIYDLLAPPDKRVKLRLREDSAGNVYVKGVTQAFVRSGEEAYDVMVAGKHNLVVAATGIHAQSSRSHCIFTITLLTEKDGEIRTSQVRLCDLAGAERQRSARNTGARMLESRAINSSLHVLERCLHMLRRKQHIKDGAIVPYRECKLTRLLGSGLSGARGEAVTMVVTINPSPQYAHETRHVLSLAVVAKDIQINNTVDPTVTMISSLECTQDSTVQDYSDEILRLRTENERLHFELLQAQSCNTQLRRAMEEKQQQSASTMMELVEETKDMMRDFYEKQLATIRSQLRETEEDHENRIAEMAEKIMCLEQLLRSKDIQIQHLRECLKKIHDVNEGQDSINLDPIHNSDITTGPAYSSDTNIYPDYSSSSDNESDSETDLDESLEPVNQIRKSILLREMPEKQEAVIDLINESTEEESEDEESKHYTNNDDGVDEVVQKGFLSREFVEKTNDSLYATGDDDDSGMEGGHIEIQTDSLANLTLPVITKNVQDMTFEVETSKNNMEDPNADKDKSVCEELFNVSTKLDKTVEGIQKNVMPNARGTYFIKKEPQEDLDLGQKFKTLTARGTYFVGERALSFYKESNLQDDSLRDQESVLKITEYPIKNKESPVKNLESGTEPAVKNKESPVENKESPVENKESPVENKESAVINEESPVKDKESPVKNKESLITNKEPPAKNKKSPAKNMEPQTEFVKPKKITGTLADKILKSFKNRQNSGSSLSQFEQLELAVNKADKTTDAVKNVEITIPTQILKGKRYFDDTKEVLNTTVDINKPAKDPTNNTKSYDNFKLKYFEDIPDEKKHCQLSDTAKTQEKRLLFDSPETSTNSSEKRDKSITLETDESIQSHILTPKIVKVKEAQLYYTENDKLIHNDVLISKSPCIMTDDTTEEYEPSIALKKVLGESFTKPDILCSIRKERLAAKKHESVDIFESPLSSITKASSRDIGNVEIPDYEHAEEPKENINSEIATEKPINEKVNAIANEFIESLITNQKIKAYIQRQDRASAKTHDTEESVTNNIRNDKNTIETMNAIKEESLERTSFTVASTIVNTTNNEVNINKNETNSKTTNNIEIQINQPLNDTQTSKGNNTVDEFEKIVKDLTNVRATDFELLLSEEAIVQANTKPTQDIHSNEKNEISERTKKFEETKYNLRNKGKSILNISDEAKDKTEQTVESTKTKSTTKRCLRLRRRKNLEEDIPDQENEKLKDIGNLKKEFSDVTLGLPVMKRDMKDIPSPEKLPGEEENVPPMMGIQSCPSKSVTRSRRKLFTPRAEPLEESPDPAGDSSERLYVPRPSYHRPRARARRKL